jgi:hypothetical protein
MDERNSGSLPCLSLLFSLQLPVSKTKTLYIRRLCTDRRQDAAVIFLFGLEALFTRDSRAHLSAVLSVPNYWLLLALSVI